VSNYFWTYNDWGRALPSLGSDEYCRHTLVLPNPFKVSSVDEKDGMKYHPALVVVIGPWWACRHVFSKENRREVREIRAQSRAFEAEMAAEEPAGS